MPYVDKVTVDNTTYDLRDTTTAQEVSDLKLGNASSNKNSGPNDTTYQGVHYIKNADGSVTLSGQSTATSFYNIFQQETAFPDGIYPGGIYSLSFSAINPNITLRIYFYIDSDWHSQEWFTDNAIIRVPENATGMIIRIGVISGVTIEEETIKPIVWSTLTNSDLLTRLKIIKESITPVSATSWQKGVYSAAGTLGDGNYASSDIVSNISDVYLEPGISCVLLLYKNSGYVGKVNSEGSIDKVAGSWTWFTNHVEVYPYLEKANANGAIVVLRPDNGYPVTTENVNQFARNNCVIYTDKYITQNYSQIAQDGLVYALNNPLLPYYSKFKFASVSNDDNHISIGENTTVRCSTVVRFEKPIYLSMINPDYSFGIYWYDSDNVFHSKKWDTMWEIPSGVSVGISIRRHEASSNPEAINNETPWIYLVPFNNDIPKDYFLAEINDTINKVKSAYTEPGLCFMLSTDHHYMTIINWLLKYDSISDMVTNMKAVSKEINIDGNIALGDVADFKIPYSTAVAERFGIKDTSYANLNEIFYHWMRYGIKQLKAVHPNLIYTPGNHDDNRYLNTDGEQSTVSAWDYTEDEVFSYYVSNSVNERVSNIDNNGLDYYIDYPQHKIRLITIDSNYYDSPTKSWKYGYANETVTWLTNVLSNTPSTYSVLLLSHMSPVYSHNADNAQYQNFVNIQNAIQTFINNGGDYIATFYGHSHKDWSVSQPWLEIAFCCQKCHQFTETIENMPDAIAPERNVGTYTEDCWNVVLILPKTRKIKVIRFGAGNDAVYSY